MMRYKILAIIITSLSIYLYFSVKRDIRHVKHIKTDMVAQCVKLNEISPDNSGFKLEAQRMELSNNNELLCNSVSCTVVTEKNDTAYLTAEELLINRDTKNLFLEKQVTGTINDFYLMGSSLKYDFNNKVLESNVSITLKHLKFQVSAKKTSIDLKNKSIHLQDVDSEFYTLAATTASSSLGSK